MIIKVQRPMPMGTPGPWVVYSEGRQNMRLMEHREFPMLVREVMASYDKAYFQADVLEGGSLKFIKRVEDQQW